MDISFPSLSHELSGIAKFNNKIGENIVNDFIMYDNNHDIKIKIKQLLENKVYLPNIYYSIVDDKTIEESKLKLAYFVFKNTEDSSIKVFLKLKYGQKFEKYNKTNDV